MLAPPEQAARDDQEQEAGEGCGAGVWEMRGMSSILPEGGEFGEDERHGKADDGGYIT